MADKVRVFDYLNALRDSGITNMFSATPYIQRVFDVPRKEAMDLLVEWMETFDGRNPA
jgi:hypothetical protein